MTRQQQSHFLKRPCPNCKAEHTLSYELPTRTRIVCVKCKKKFIITFKKKCHPKS